MRASRQLLPVPGCDSRTPKLRTTREHQQASTSSAELGPCESRQDSLSRPSRHPRGAYALGSSSSPNLRQFTRSPLMSRQSSDSSVERHSRKQRVYYVSLLIDASGLQPTLEDNFDNGLTVSCPPYDAQLSLEIVSDHEVLKFTDELKVHFILGPDSTAIVRDGFFLETESKVKVNTAIKDPRLKRACRNSDIRVHKTTRGGEASQDQIVTHGHQQLCVSTVWQVGTNSQLNIIPEGGFSVSLALHLMLCVKVSTVKRLSAP